MKLNNNAPGFWQKFSPSVAAAVLLATNLLLFTPFSIYHFNRDEFNVSFSAILINFYLPGSRVSFVPKGFYGKNPELLATHKNIERLASLATPLFVVKPPFKSDPFKVSTAETMLTDLPATRS